MPEGVGVTNHDNRLLWAQRAYRDPVGVGAEMLPAVLAANKDATVANITGATDAAIQTNVGDAVDLFADGT